jgi:hypothetical protein
MRCYFNLENGGEVILDHEGIDIAGIDEAHSEALQAMDEMREEEHAAGADWNGWTLKVCDRSGAVLICIDLEETCTA